MKKRHVNTSIIVSCDFPNEKENDGILIVGRPHGGKIDILNAFDGKEARDIWDKLITVKKEETNGRSNSERKED